MYGRLTDVLAVEISAAGEAHHAPGCTPPQFDEALLRAVLFILLRFFTLGRCSFLSPGLTKAYS
jgi:hypothetical protein